MVRIKLQLDKKNNVKFKLKISNEDAQNVFLKRALLEGRELKSDRFFNYEIPIRFLKPVITVLSKENIVLDKRSIVSFIQFSDIYDERYYYDSSINPKFLKLWRENNCPDIYKIEINKDTLDIESKIIVSKPKINLGDKKVEHEY